MLYIEGSSEQYSQRAFQTLIDYKFLKFTYKEKNAERQEEIFFLRSKEK